MLQWLSTTAPTCSLPCREVCSRGGYKVGNGINWKVGRAGSCGC